MAIMELSTPTVNNLCDEMPGWRVEDWSLHGVVNLVGNNFLEEARLAGGGGGHAIETSFVGMPLTCFEPEVDLGGIGMQIFFIPFAGERALRKTRNINANNILN